jgi:hypothetical protein
MRAAADVEEENSVQGVNNRGVNGGGFTAAIEEIKQPQDAKPNTFHRQQKSE